MLHAHQYRRRPKEEMLGHELGQEQAAGQEHVPSATHSPSPGPGKPAVCAAPPSSRTHQRSRYCSNLHTAVPGHRCCPGSHPEGEEGRREKQEKNKDSQSTCKRSTPRHLPLHRVFSDSCHLLRGEHVPGDNSKRQHSPWTQDLVPRCIDRQTVTPRS